MHVDEAVLAWRPSVEGLDEVRLALAQAAGIDQLAGGRPVLRQCDRLAEAAAGIARGQRLLAGGELVDPLLQPGRLAGGVGKQQFRGFKAPVVMRSIF